MNAFLLDTCTFIWLGTEPDKLSEKVARTIDDPESTLILSDGSAMEITLKWQAGKLVLPDPPGYWIESQIAAWKLDCRPINRADIYRAGELPDHHRDPFDRLLIAVALNHKATILTPDKAIHQYPVSYRW